AWADETGSASVSFLNRWDGGPGEGHYIAYVRAVDPAANIDYSYVEGLNMYTWHYVSPLPWGIIFGTLGGFLALVLLVYAEYRRRKKKRAMQRYAMKRMRRKFKQQQKKRVKDLDWREIYDESGKPAAGGQGTTSKSKGKRKGGKSGSKTDRK
ncbi:unnamed protein product, partial [Phaeothamnion confervicola]